MASKINDLSCSLEILEEDILEAMKSMEGYIDITPIDFKEFYIKAYKHARERLLQGVTADMVMNKPVHSISSDKNISLAAYIMAKEKISGLPVLNENKEVVGVISEKDFLRKLSKGEVSSFMSLVTSCLSNKGCMALPLKTLKVSDIMTAPAITVDQKTVLSEAINLLKEKEINRLPVKDKNNRLVGIITRTDIISSLFTVCNY